MKNISLAIYLCATLFNGCITGTIKQMSFERNNDGMMFTFYFRATSSRGKSRIGCLVECGIVSTDCVGVDINTVTRECLGYDY